MGMTRDMDLSAPRWENAACDGMDTDIFFDDLADSKKRAELRELCASCPIIDQCRDWGLNHEVYGFWGGLSADERRGVRRKLGINIYYITPDRLGVAP